MNSRCSDCGGSGRDDAKTNAKAQEDAEFRHRVKHHGTYVRCWTCNGNGNDPAEDFRWTPSHGDPRPRR
jgi:hypothetical protein